MLKSLINRVPLLRNLVHKMLAVRSQRSFQGSANYWEDRYRRGGDSGAGSYSRLAKFKAEILNKFVTDRKIQSVIEFGCGDGHQLSLAQYPRYVGMDVAATAVESCRNRYQGDDSKEFHQYFASEFECNDERFRADLSLSLDVIYHLVEDETFEAHLRHLFGSAKQYVIIYSSNCEEPQMLAHVRRRNFVDTVEENFPDWLLSEQIANRYPFIASRPDDTSKADFYIYSKSNI